MTRGILVLTVFAAVAVLAAPADSSSTAGRRLVGTTGPGFTITLTRHGEPVTSLEPGNYRLTVNDLSTFHNFHIFGPGLDEVVTQVPFTGTVTLKVHLEHGEYTFQCDPHASRGMKGTFTVEGVGQT